MNPTVHTISRRSNCLRVAIAAILSMGYSIGAHAQELSLSSTVTVNQTSGAFSASPSITASTGNVADVSNIPTLTNGIPNFTFSFQGTGVASSTKTFTPGLVIQQVGSSRRLEAQLPLLTLTFDASSNIISGSSGVAAGNIEIRGRDNSGTISVSGIFADNGSSISITNTAIGFNAGTIMSRIVAANPGNVLNDVINSFSAGGAYTYTLVMKPVNDAALKLGTGGTGASLTQFPKLNLAACLAGQTATGTQNDAASVFILTTGGSLAANFTNGYALQGRLGVGQAAGGTLGNLGISCVTTPPAGGGGGSTAANDTAISNNVTSLTNQLAEPGTPSPAVVTAVTNFASDAIAQINAGIASPSSALGVLDTLNTLLGKQTFTSDAGNTGITNSLNVLDLLNSSITALQGKTLTPTEKTSLVSKVANMASSLGATLTPSSAGSATSIASALDKLGSAIASAATVLSSGTVPSSLFTQATALSQTASTITNLGTSSADAYALASIALQSASSSIQNTAPIRQPGGDSDSGVSVLSATVVNSLNPSETKVDKGTGTIFTAQTSLLNAINVAGTTANYDASSGLVDIVSGSTYLPTYLVETSLITTNFTAGVITSANGSAIAVNGGIGSTLVPAPRDRGGLISVLEKAGISVVFEADGSLNLTPATGDRLTGVFGFDDVDTGTLGTAAVTFTLPTGNPKSTSYVITAKYSDGSSQKIQPYVAANSFYDSLQALNVDVTTNRSNGVISGPNNLSLRPDYFIKSVTASDTTFHASNKDSFGIAYRQTTDFNGDGNLDVEVITATDKQVLYVLP